MMQEPPEVLTSEQELARQALLALTSAPADPDFRAALRREFVAGSFAARAARGPERLRGTRWFGRGALWIAIPAALAATFVAVSLLNRAPAMSVSAASGEGIAVIGNVPVPIQHVADLRRLVRPGVRIRIPEGASLEVTYPGEIAIQVVPGTEAVLPREPGRWFARSAHAEIMTGELRVTTGPRFRGARLAIETPEARVEVSGTTLAVICEPQGTCVCVFDGRVRVGEKAGPMVDVDQGMRRYVFNDGRAPELAKIRDTETTKLGEFREQERSSMK